MEEMVVRTVNNHVIPLKKGYMIVKCRGQQDINEKLDLIKALEKERRFFYENSHFRQENVFGFENLLNSVNSLRMSNKQCHVCRRKTIG